MSETFVEDTAGNDPSISSFLLDGEMPRLAPSMPIVPPQPLELSGLDGGPVAAFGAASGGPSPLLPAPAVTAVPVITDLAGPSLPSVDLMAAAAAAAEQADAAAATSDEPRHPMAHLMPQKSKPTEASLRAAEARAAKKKKARKIKIAVLVGFLGVGVLVGPSIGKWFMNAINDAGKTKTEEPAATVAPATSAPATEASVAPATSAPTASVAPASVAPAPSTPVAATTAPGLVDAIDDAQAAVDATNGGTVPAP